MSYKINFTDSVNKEGITVNDNVVNTSTSLEFPGRNQKGYAITIAENFLHLLENFAKSSPPPNPIEGQLWYDSSPGIENLMIYDGTNWKSSGSLKKGNEAPTNNVLGDLWVDSTNQQLKLFNGATWILVGPTYSTGLRTGAVAEPVKDQSINQTEHIVLTNYVDDKAVSILSDTAFTPKSGITGFDTIKAGINLNNNSSYKFWGTSEKAENLIVGGISIPAVNFLRSDLSNTTTQEFIVKNDTGLTVGNEKQLLIRVSDTRGVVYHSTPNSRLDFRISLGLTASETTLLSLDSTYGSILVGPGNTDTNATLSVKGSGKFTGAVAITDSTETDNISTGSLLVGGGAVISKKLRVGGELTVNDIVNSKSIIPIDNNISNLGSSTKKFSDVYATTFNGNLVGNVRGTIEGSVTGTASKLVTGTTFKIDGDVTSDPITFDGDGTDKTFTTIIGSDFIANKPSLDDPDIKAATLDVDQMLIYRPYVPSGDIEGIYKISKSTFTSTLSLVPIGAVFPFAGTTIPYGYLLCDGSEKRINIYPDLFNVIEYTYAPASQLVGVGTFRLPDLRGRFPLGLNNMSNNDTVPVSGGSTVSSGGGPANRVNADTANELGRGAGVEQLTLDISKIPNHKHKLTDDLSNTQFYVTNNSSSTPVNSNITLGDGGTEPNGNQYYSTTGNIDTTTTGQPINIMNPYLAINYIIYAGVPKI